MAVIGHIYLLCHFCSFWSDRNPGPVTSWPNIGNAGIDKHNQQTLHTLSRKANLERRKLAVRGRETSVAKVGCAKWRVSLLCDVTLFLECLLRFKAALPGFCICGDRLTV